MNSIQGTSPRGAPQYWQSVEYSAKSCLQKIKNWIAGIWASLFSCCTKQNKLPVHAIPYLDPFLEDPRIQNVSREVPILERQFNEANTAAERGAIFARILAQRELINGLHLEIARRTDEADARMQQAIDHPELNEPAEFREHPEAYINLRLRPTISTNMNANHDAYRMIHICFVIIRLAKITLEIDRPAQIDRAERALDDARARLARADEISRRVIRLAGELNLQQVQMGRREIFAELEGMLQSEREANLALQA